MKKKSTLTLVMSFLLLLVTASYMWIASKVDKILNTPLQLQQAKYFVLPAGTVPFALKQKFIDTGLLSDDLPQSDFIWFMLTKLHPELMKVKTGTYQIAPSITLKSLLEQLTIGKEAQFSFRIKEGQRLDEVLVALKRAQYLQQRLPLLSESEKIANPHWLAAQLALADDQLLEGWFYPDTYYYTAGSDDISLLKRAYDKMQKTALELWQNRAENLPYKTPAEMVTLASIVEKETGRVDERALVASVFINRLNKGMPLQTDPTVIYGLGPPYPSRVTYHHLSSITLYNTYRVTGLPPSPIAMPSLASLQAAAHPAKTAYFYFVADGKGGHIFNRTFADHQHAVNAYRKYLKGKNAQ